jgi:hypothetical protein
MEILKRKVISFWLTHMFLRRIGKHYPEYFEQWMQDLTDDNTTRKIMMLRYTGSNPMKFEAISYELYVSPRRVFEKHKKVIDRIIGGV